MRYFILILCLFKLQVEASDWANRTIRVDLNTNPTTVVANRRNGPLEQAVRTLNGLNATNGQYPWTILTSARSSAGSGAWAGITCSSSIISENFALTDFYCTGRQLNPLANVIEAFVGGAQWASPLPLARYVRHFWYIEPEFENRPNIVLLRLHEPLTFNPNIQPIRLPSLVDFSYEGWASHMLGFDTPPGLFTAQLQFANTNIRENSVCDFLYNFADYEMCAIEAGPGYAGGSIIRYNGFTGGAWLVFEYTESLEYVPVLIGIHQYQYANETAAFGRSSRVSHFLEWIRELTAEVAAEF